MEPHRDTRPDPVAFAEEITDDEREVYTQRFAELLEQRVEGLSSGEKKALDWLTKLFRNTRKCNLPPNPSLRLRVEDRLKAEGKWYGG